MLLSSLMIHIQHDVDSLPCSNGMFISSLTGLPLWDPASHALQDSTFHHQGVMTLTLSRSLTLLLAKVVACDAFLRQLNTSLASPSSSSFHNLIPCGFHFSCNSNFGLWPHEACLVQSHQTQTVMLTTHSFWFHVCMNGTWSLCRSESLRSICTKCYLIAVTSDSCIHLYLSKADICEFEL